MSINPGNYKLSDKTAKLTATGKSLFIIYNWFFCSFILLSLKDLNLAALMPFPRSPHLSTPMNAYQENVLDVMPNIVTNLPSIQTNNINSSTRILLLQMKYENA